MTIQSNKLLPTLNQGRRSVNMRSTPLETPLGGGYTPSAYFSEVTNPNQPVSMPVVGPPGLS